MLIWLWCRLVSHDWKGVSVKEMRLRGGGYEVVSIMECLRCRKWVTRSKRILPESVFNDDSHSH